MKKLSVIIPAFNEEQRICNTLLLVCDFLKNQAYDYEILIVNDGSTDKTEEVIKHNFANNSKIKIITHVPNKGKGYAVKQGILNATGDISLYMDADNSTPITHLPNMLQKIESGYDVVIGSIEAQGASIIENSQYYRRFVGHWSKYLIRVVAGLWEIKDTQRGFKVFKTEIAKQIFSKMSISGFAFDVELLVIAKKMNCKILEVPVIWNNSSGSTVTVKSYFQVLKDLFQIRLNLILGKY